MALHLIERSPARDSHLQIKHYAPVITARSFHQRSIHETRRSGALPETGSKPERERASVPVSRDSRGFPKKFGLARTLALPNGLLPAYDPQNDGNFRITATASS